VNQSSGKFFRVVGKINLEISAAGPKIEGRNHRNVKIINEDNETKDFKKPL
jgi:hypothetical protein